MEGEVVDGPLPLMQAGRPSETQLPALTWSAMPVAARRATLAPASRHLQPLYEYPPYRDRLGHLELDLVESVVAFQRQLRHRDESGS